jgi:hypothetical protein
MSDDGMAKLWIPRQALGGSEKMGGDNSQAKLRTPREEVDVDLNCFYPDTCVRRMKICRVWS